MDLRHNTARPMEALLNLTAEEMFIPQTDDPDYLGHVVRYHLEHRFVGRCKGGCLIVGIGPIHQRSMTRMAQDQLDGSGNMNVRFTALGCIISPGDILVGCVVDTVKGDRVVLRGGHVLVTVVGPNLPSRVIKGQSVPVVVSRSTYVESSQHVAVDAVPFRAPYEICLYQITPRREIPTDLLGALREELDALYAAQKAFEAASAPRRRYFRQLFHLLAEPIPASALPKGVRVLKAQEMAESLVQGREVAPGSLLQHPLSEASEGELLLMPADMLKVTPGQRPILEGPAVLHLDKLTSQSVHGGGDDPATPDTISTYAG
jgi:hypothetical protein